MPTTPQDEASPQAPAPHAGTPPAQASAPSLPTHYYFNRELSWLRFNERVLEEAMDPTHPLMERLKFLAIFSSNLDEFFQIRVAGLKEQVSADIISRTPDGMTAAETLAKIAEMLLPLIEAHSRTYVHHLLPELSRQQVRIEPVARLSAAQRQQLQAYFSDHVFPILTPLAIDPAHPFPKLRGLGINLLVELSTTGADPQPRRAVVPVPALLPRFYALVQKPVYEFVLIEDIIREHLPALFPNMKIEAVSEFRVTRNADLDIAEAEADDLLKLIERELRKRRLGTVIRLEVNADMSEANCLYLQRAFGLEPADVYKIRGHLGFANFLELLGHVDEPALRDEPFHPAAHPQFMRHDSIFEAIRERDILLHHPYDSFLPVVQLIEAAAKDPAVLAIKQTLYRTTGRSPIVAALREAATSGKQVSVLIELKARFDEETNINWARELERVGVNVVYGIVGLKTHCKVLQILRQEPEGIRPYVHLSTGNYNEKTATIYTDLSLFTSNREIGADVAELFNLLTGYSGQQSWRKILVAPVNMRQEFLRLIEAAIAAHTPGLPSRIRLVMNSLVDQEMIQALYRASAAGVRVQAQVRGICCLVPGVPGVSENITVISTVGRFLEHRRVFAFDIGGRQHIYSGSADWMPRNLNRRIEVVFPIEDEALKAQASEILDASLADNVKARELRPDGTYVRRSPAAGQNGAAASQALSAQALFLRQARERQASLDSIYAD